MEQETQRLGLGTFVQDKVQRDDPGQEATPAMVFHNFGVVADATVDGQPLADYGDNPEYVDDPEDEPVVGVMFDSWLDQNVSRWETVEYTGTDLRTFVFEYCNMWSIPIRTGIYEYPQSRLEPIDDPR